LTKQIFIFLYVLLNSPAVISFKVHGNYDGAVKINKPRRYRQYMNRKGGFNRPLDYIA
uniref:U4/U6.U5 small nuclear ribonucleoprotein 27 kDa protein n=1 Tax=Angiostrongylus cantonensis TaxID=6313 RepID=A0A0K0CYS9_ANGCA